jgi:hypothetical protein
MNMNENNAIATLDQPHARVSAKYQLVPTKVIAQKFYDLGFKLDEYKSVRVRDASRIGYQKHFVRLSHPTLLNSRHNDLKFQLLITNSHDGSSSFKMQLGIFRLVCANGLVVGTVFESVALRHSGRVLEEIEPAIERIVAQITKLDDALDKMKGRQLSTAEMQKFYAEAVKFRYGDKVQGNDVEILSRRTADDANDLFTVYNRAQEALVRGSRVVGSNGRFRQRRAITNINKDKAINEKLFDLAYSYIGEARAA